MSILSAIRDYLRPPDLEERMLTPAQVWGRGGIWRPISSAGVQVTAETAMQAAVGACVRLLADDISGLPVDIMRKTPSDDRVPATPPIWVQYPTGRRWDSFQAHLSDVVVSLLSEGNVFIECTPDTFRPQYFSVKDPREWDILLEEGGVVYRGPNGQRLDETRMAHIPWVRLPGQLRGLSPFSASEDSSGLELAARQWAGAFFANGGTVGNVIKHPGKPSADEIDIMRESFEKRHKGSENAFRLGILTGGADLVNGAVKPDEAALEPLWKHVLEEAARLYHIPPHLLGSQDTGSASYASVEQRSIEYVQHAIVPVTTRIEAAYTRLLGGDRYLKLNVNGLLRGDFQSRMQGYRVLMETRVMSKEAVRELEDLPKDDNETGYLATPNNQTRDFRTEDAKALIQAGFDPTAVLTVVGLPPMPHNGLAPVTQQADEEPAQPRTTDAMGIHISGEVTDEAVERISRSATEALATVASGLTGDFRKLAAELIAEQQDTARRLSAIEERERQRSLPVSIRVKGDEVYEQRGDEIVKKRITRDETGKVIGLIAEVA